MGLWVGFTVHQWFHHVEQFKQPILWVQWRSTLSHVLQYDLIHLEGRQN